MDLFPDHLLNHLPPQSRPKLARLEARLDDLGAASFEAHQALFEERGHLTKVKMRLAPLLEDAARRRVTTPEQEAEDAAAAAELASVEARVQRAQDRNDRASEAREAWAFVSNLAGWLKDFHRSRWHGSPAKLVHAPWRGKLAGDPHRIVSTLRQDITAVDVEWKRIESAPMPVADIRADISAALDAIARDFAPSVNLRARGGDPARIESLFRTGAPGTKDLAAGMIVWALRDQIEQRLMSLVPAKDEPGAMSNNARDDAFERLAVQKLALERQEEAAIVAAESQGIEIVRRAEVDPRAVLEVAEA